MYCKKCGKEVSNNEKFCTNCGWKNQLIEGGFSINQHEEKHKNKKNILIITGIIVVVVITSLITFILKKEDIFTVQNSQGNLENIEINNLKSVVQIMCDDDSGGSGTMISNDGYILTNHHVIADAEWCLITIPEEKTGEPAEIYYSYPIIIPKVSEDYDIAMLKIDGVYTDEDGKSWGSYPNNFISFQTNESCENKNQTLGNQIKIYGYPTTTHNLNLTITEGIISNFDSGYILTSAKIDSGNSGGLAMDNEGCWVGIPSAILEGNYQNLGVIIPTSIISNFIEEAELQDDSSEVSNKIPTPTLSPKVTKVPQTPKTNDTEDEINKSTYQWVGTFCPQPSEIINFTSIESIGNGRVRLKWSPVSNGQSSYSIFHSMSSSGFTYLTAGGSDGTVEIGGLEQNKKHYFLITIGLINPYGTCAASHSRSVMVN